MYMRHYSLAPRYMKYIIVITTILINKEYVLMESAG